MTGNVLQRVISRFKRPQRVVNLCFIAVFLFSTMLTWREVVVLESAYVASQRNSLDNIAIALDRQLQYSIDNLLFYRDTMRYALQSPISTDKSRQALAAFDIARTQSFWQLKLDINRSLPISGVSDEFVHSNPLLDRGEKTTHAEIEAALEFSHIMQLSDRTRDLQRRIFYASRAGFFLTSTPPVYDPQIISLYHRLVDQSYFASQSPQNNPRRELQWTHTYNPAFTQGQIITAAVPLDYEDRWYGVLAMDFPIESMHRFLCETRPGDEDGVVILVDNKFTLIASSAENLSDSALFSPAQQAEIAAQALNAKRGDEGELRLDSRFVTWSKLNNFDGLLIKVHTLKEGVDGEFGRISIVLSILWMLSTLMLVGSWWVIRRLVSNMLDLQKTLSWRANYDTLTQLYSRGAFFDAAHRLAAECRLRGEPFSVIQMDLDFFKSINDRFGHHGGDKVLAHASAILAGAIRKQDIAGRVGGEEFSIVLPGAMLDEAALIAERIRSRINSREIVLTMQQTVKISASFGVSCAQELGGYDFERLQSLADQRLYKAKQAGRNQICTRS